ncbi:MAG: metal-dependent hydrolase [Pirellulaceae bacterium]
MPRIAAMTTFEHVMLAINGCLATGLPRRHGWNLVALAACSAVVPDWDGLTLLGGGVLFDLAHRTWGHSLLVSLLLATILGICDYRFDLMGRVANLYRRLTRPQLKNPPLRGVRQRSWRGYMVWSSVSLLATLSHLAADVVFSGGHGLPDWELKLFWPFSERGIVYPLVPWGDVGVTLVFVAGMFALYRWRDQARWIAGATLALVVLYAALRGAIVA